MLLSRLCFHELHKLKLEGPQRRPAFLPGPNRIYLLNNIFIKCLLCAEASPGSEDVYVYKKEENPSLDRFYRLGGKRLYPVRMSVMRTSKALTGLSDVTQSLTFGMEEKWN